MVLGVTALVVAVAGAGAIGSLIIDRAPTSPTVVGTDTPTSDPTVSDPVTADPTVTAPPGAWLGQAPLFGASFQQRPGEGYGQALRRTDAALDLQVIRVFYQGAPDPWPGKAPNRDVVVSFKMPPQDVLAGDYDDQMRQWFADAPRDHKVFWVYWHEPEDDAEQGLFTPEQYRQAYARLDGLADEADNPNLASTVVLMSWATRTETSRNWRDYVPPVESFDILAWDAYNRVATRGDYLPADDLLGPAQQASASIGKPFAIAELGSQLRPGDDGSDRAKWLLDIGRFAREHDAVFVTYFDFNWKGTDDFRLSDPASQQAWRTLAAKGEQGS